MKPREQARWVLWTLAAWRRLRANGPEGRHRAAESALDDRPGADGQFAQWRPPYRPPRRLNDQWQADNAEQRET